MCKYHEPTGRQISQLSNSDWGIVMIYECVRALISIRYWACMLHLRRFLFILNHHPKVTTIYSTITRIRKHTLNRIYQSCLDQMQMCCFCFFFLVIYVARRTHKAYGVYCLRIHVWKYTAHHLLSSSV